MVNTFINPVINPDAKLGFDAFEGSPIQLWEEHSDTDVAIVIRAAYRHVLGNAHLMESERLITLESQLLQGDISVREFIRGLAKSDLYRSRFFDNHPRSRFIELNFKHLLGRAPDSYEELVHHTHLLDTAGYDAEIDSYLDSEEYDHAFGENIVPFYRGQRTQSGQRIVGFSNLLTLFRGASSSDKVIGDSERSRLGIALMTDTPNPVITPSGPQLPWASPTPSTWVPWKYTPPVRDITPATRFDPFSGLQRFAQLTKTTVPGLTATVQEKSSETIDLHQQYQGYQAFEGDPVELLPNASDAEYDQVIRTIYRQVLGNAHIMESERLTVPESQLKRGEISVREFVRWVAKSDLYRSRFVDNCYRYRSIELNFKHLLGRAPDTFDEMRHHSTVLDQEGFEADIDSYLDSDEYQHVFGEMIVPYYRGYKTQPGQSMLEFTHMLKLLRSASSSDKDLVSNKPRVAESIISSAAGLPPARDVRDILAEVFKSKSPPSPAIGSPSIPEADTALQRQYDEQQAIIERLQTQLKDLQPLAGIGASVIRQSQFGSLSSGSSPVSPDSSEPRSLAQDIERQSTLIANLERQIADARSLSAIGESRLNRWRQRSF